MPQSLRALYGSNGTANACHGSENPAAAAREIEFFFGAGGSISGTASLTKTTLCLIKPHAIENGNIGKIISMVRYFIIVCLHFYIGNVCADC